MIPFDIALLTKPILCKLLTTLHYSTLLYTKLNNTTLHYTTLNYTALLYTTLNNTTLHYTTPHSTTLNYTALLYTTLNNTTLHYTTLHYTTPHSTTLFYATQRRTTHGAYYTAPLHKAHTIHKSKCTNRPYLISPRSLSNSQVVLRTVTALTSALPLSSIGVKGSRGGDSMDAADDLCTCIIHRILVLSVIEKSSNMTSSSNSSINNADSSITNRIKGTDSSAANKPRRPLQSLPSSLPSSSSSTSKSYQQGQKQFSVDPKTTSAVSGTLLMVAQWITEMRY